MSLVGALAWIVLTEPAICIYVSYLQRHTQAPTMKHVRDSNRLLRWIKKNLKQLGVRFNRLAEPLRLVALSESAFKAQEYNGLVMRRMRDLPCRSAGGRTRIGAALPPN